MCMMNSHISDGKLSMNVSDWAECGMRAFCGVYGVCVAVCVRMYVCVYGRLGYIYRSL